VSPRRNDEYLADIVDVIAASNPLIALPGRSCLATTRP